MTLFAVPLLAFFLVLAANFSLRFALGRFILQATPFVFALGLLILTYQQPSHPWLYLLLSALSALLVAAIALPVFRRLFARFLPIDPTHPLHTATLAFALTYILNHFLTYLVTGPKPASSIALSSLDVFLSQLATFILFVGLAFFGIGALTRRSPGSLVGRLGFSRPNRFQLFFAFGFAAAFQLIGLLGVFLSHLLTPGLAQNVDQSSSNLLGGLLSTPEGILFLVLTAAFGEELLFRGALQPRLGLVLTALLFTALHDQYGFSFELLSIFVLALALGWLRSRMNLWACIVAHFFFDLLGALVGTPLISLGLGLLGLAVCLLLLRSSAPRLFPIPDSSSIRWQQV